MSMPGTAIEESMASEKLDLVAKGSLDFMVLGVGRSGTTMLASDLNRSDDIHILPETQIIRRLFSRQSRALRDPELAPRVLEAEFRRVDYQLDIDDLDRSVRTLDCLFEPGDLYRIVVRQARRSQASAKLIGDKAPIATEHLGLLLRIFPLLHTVQVCRQPQDVLLSRQKAKWSEHYRLWQHLLAIRSQTRSVERFGEIHEDRKHTVYYEQYVADPDAQRSELRTKLGLSASAQTDSEPQAERTEPWHSNVGKAISSASVGSGSAGLTARAARALELTCETPDAGSTLARRAVYRAWGATSDAYLAIRRLQDLVPKARVCASRFSGWHPLQLQYADEDRIVLSAGLRLIDVSSVCGNAAKWDFGSSRLDDLPLLTRLRRRLIHGVRRQPDGSLVVLSSGQVSRLSESGSEPLSVELPFRRPLRQGWDLGDDRILIGEYQTHEVSPALRVFEVDWVCGRLNPVLELAPGTARHIHGVQQLGMNIVICTGDSDQHAKILSWTPKGETIEKIAGGSQLARTCSVTDGKEGLVFATDAPGLQNFLMQVSASGDECMRQLGEISGPHYYSMQIGDFSAFSRAVERTPNELDDYLGVTTFSHTDETTSWHPLAKKDRLHNKYFGHGVCWFPNGTGLDYDDRVFLNLEGAVRNGILSLSLCESKLES